MGRDSNRTWIAASITVAALVVALVQWAFGPALYSLAQHAPERTDARSASNAFSQYVSRLRALPDAAARAAELEQPARAIFATDSDARRALGIEEGDVFPIERRAGHTTLECALGDALAEHWLALAERAGERDALRDAVHALLREETARGCRAADPALFAFACAFAGRFETEADARRLVPWFAPRVAAELDARAREGDRSDASLLPALALLASAGRFEWARAELVGLLARPALRDGPHLPLVASLATRGSSFAEWGPALDRSLAAEAGDARYGALAVLRSFARRRDAAEQPVLGERELVERLPDSLVSAADAGLRRAAIELLADCGGAAGRERLLGLLDAGAAPSAELLRALASGSCARAGEDAPGRSAR